MFLQEVLALAINMFHDQTVNYLSNHVWTILLYYRIPYQVLKGYFFLFSRYQEDLQKRIY